MNGRRASISWGFLLLVGLASAGVTHAEAQAAPPDVVRLTSGAMYRGTISEMVPGESVVMLTVSGETVRFTMDEVVYAGPASDDPSAEPTQPAAPPAAEPAEPDGVPIRFVGLQPETQLHYFRGSTRSQVGNYTLQINSFEAICTAPCRAALEPGMQRLAISVGDRDPQAVRAFRLDEPATLQASYRSRLGMRIGGFILALGVGSAGVGLAAFGAIDGNTAMLIGGIVMAVIGYAAGLPMALKNDDANIEVLPPDQGADPT